jgi:hypothetical protein
MMVLRNVKFEHIALKEQIRTGELTGIPELARCMEFSRWVNPLAVSSPKGEEYRLVAGERRHAAIALLRKKYPHHFIPESMGDDGKTLPELDLDRIPVQIVGVDDELRVQVSENRCRVDLNFFQLASAFARLRQAGEEASTATGYSAGYVKQVLRAWDSMTMEMRSKARDLNFSITDAFNFVRSSTAPREPDPVPPPAPVELKPRGKKQRKKRRKMRPRREIEAELHSVIEDMRVSGDDSAGVYNATIRALNWVLSGE